MKIKKIIVLVELENGNAHQVLASREQKEICLSLLSTEDGVLRLSSEIEAVSIRYANTQPPN